ncbi:hypothetical protein ABIC83_002575 [Roseateles asaccharophilus]|uniref:hypothetical protein n=1 Tax=Roseateles asaccharophilus TaxID=582607 RepID=UPI0038364DBF
MKIFVDTEFVSKSFPEIKDPAMLSAGLVADNGETCYVEIHNPRLHSKASNFVVDEVLGQFGRFPEAVVTTLAEAGSRIAGFFDGIEGEIVLCADFPADLYLVIDALQQGRRLDDLRSRISVKDVKAAVSGDDMREAWENAFALQGAMMGLERHHALLDAHCLKTVYEAALAAHPTMDQARHEYHLHTDQDGKVAGRAWTNDNLDQGEPSEEADWDVKYESVAKAIETTGGTHVGCSGCQVNVYLDGQLVDREGKSLEQPRARRMRP